ncbi:MAG: hypothetical protein ACAI44_23990, partial [Candidatus Sericytochromatia bacterium]
MISFYWNPSSLALAALASLLFAIYLSRLLHQRYASQFGWGFVLSGLVSLSLPAIAVIGVPVYLLLESGLA